MHSSRVVSLVCILGSIVCADANRDPHPPGEWNTEAVDAWLARRIQEPGHVGLSVAIFREGKPVLVKGYGKRSLKGDQPVETDTLFAIGSVSKQFTCAAVLLLAEDGKLSVHDPVANYYPDLTRAKDITLLDLMTHLSGYPDYYPLDFVERRMQKPIDPDNLLRRYAGGKLDFEPRTNWSYSNTGYILLGRIVEKVSGESFGAFLSRRIFKPLGMEHTAYEPDASDPRLAAGHASFALSDPQPVKPEGRGWIGAAGGIYSTPSDLAKWSLALISGQVLNPASFELMTTPATLADGRITDYACGLSVGTREGRRVLSHNGAVSGFNAWSAVIPSTRTAVVLMANQEGGIGLLPDQLLALLLKRPANIPSIAGPPALDEVQAVFARLQEGKIDRKAFTEEFNAFLTDEMIAGAAKRLAAFGQPAKVELLRRSERGGMEVTITRLTFADENLRVLMYRNPNGLIEQFFVRREE